MKHALKQKALGVTKSREVYCKQCTPMTPSQFDSSINFLDLQKGVWSAGKVIKKWTKRTKIYHALKSVFSGGVSCPLCHSCYEGSGQSTPINISLHSTVFFKHFSKTSVLECKDILCDFYCEQAWEIQLLTTASGIPAIKSFILSRLWKITNVCSVKEY